MKLTHVLAPAPSLAALLALGTAFGAPAPPGGGPPKPQATASATAGPAAASRALSLPYVRYQLKNGLTVILHEDHTQPLCVVLVEYQVGSRDERVGRTGFAHMFEHLMFMGTKRVPVKMFDEWMEREGGWNNAFTSEDRTAFYDVGPIHALPLMLWMEADRLAVLGQQIDQDKLDTQRDVVRNERRDSIENQPYGKVELRLPELLWPAAHPYHHPVIGSHADLAAANVQDVRDFFGRWYSPSNAILTIAGDVDPIALRAVIERNFAGIAAGARPTRERAASEPPRLGSVVRETMEDQVSLPQVVMAWPSPALYAPGDAELDLLAAVSSSGKASRLYKALVYDKKLAQSVDVRQSSMGLASYFQIQATARKDVSLDDLERAIDAELALLRTKPISAEELRRAQNKYEARFVSGLQSLSERAMSLSSYQAYVGNPGYLAEDLARYQRATPDSVRSAAELYLDLNARVILRIVPRPAPKEAEAKPGDDAAPRRST
jgi:zinc protease